MNDPVAILLIVVLVSAAVALWMLDGTYRGRLLKTSKRASDAEEKNTKLGETVSDLRSERDKNRQRLERMEKDRDQDREQLRKLKAKVKRQSQAKSDGGSGATDDSQDVQRLTAELKILRDELENRLNDEADHQQQIDDLTERLTQARDRLEVFEAQAKKMSRGVRVSLVDSDVEAAKEDLPGFMKRIKTEMAILERKVSRNHEAFLSQQGKTDVAVEKLKAMRDRYRAVCRELAVLISGNQNLDEQEAQAVAEQAVEHADDAANWVGSDLDHDELGGEDDSAADHDQEHTDALDQSDIETSEGSEETADDRDEEDASEAVDPEADDRDENDAAEAVDPEADESSDDEAPSEKVASEG